MCIELRRIILGVMILLGTLASSLQAAEGLPSEEIAKGLLVVHGAVNGVLLQRDGKTLAVYGDPRENPEPVDTVLFTHHRRDVVWAGRTLVSQGAKAVVPAAEVADFSEVGKFWSSFEQQRFHDYAHKSTKVLVSPMPIWKSVRGGETLTWEGLPIRVLDTPGYTPGAVTYLVELEGQRIAFTGDLLYGDGKILDLYSFQDAIPDLGMMAYHGYAARLSELIASLQQIAAERPTLIVPARGPVVRNPQKTIDVLIGRIQALYANYLSIDAHRYYSAEDRFIAKGRRVLGAEAQLTWMPSAETITPLPAWIVPIDNARLILSADKTGFLVDCGSQHIIDELKKLQTAGQMTAVEHAFISHYHDDHTDQVAELVKTFGATLHASRQNWDILENPGAYRMPCLTTNPIHVSCRAEEGACWKWKEFEMTLYFFPGQTLQHDALLVKKDTGEQFFFIGDSFTPSGIDDYCLLNRNLLREGTGYLLCLQHVRQFAPEAMLINQHVGPAFRFGGPQLDHMMNVLRQRIELLQSLFPWDDPNFGIDEGWARFYPYARTVRPRDEVTLSVRILNHSPVEQTFEVKPHLPQGWTLCSLVPAAIRIPARQEGAVEMTVAVPDAAPEGTHILTADLRWGDCELREWTEAMVTVINQHFMENPHVDDH
ncbi:MAG: MBL fold metallo-hydrolase [Pirellulaceae bacterium]